MDITENEQDDVDYINCAQEWDQWPFVLNTEMILLFPQTVKNFVTEFLLVSRERLHYVDLSAEERGSSSLAVVRLMSCTSSLRRAV
jgi:hypothetical protein